MALVSTQKLPKYSTSTRGKLTLPQHVVGKILMLFPPALRNAGKAELIMFLEGPNEGSRPFVVTASIQKLRKNGGNGVRVVLLESGWMPIVRELQLEKGDTVNIFLLNNMAWTYLIAVERAPDADRIDEVDAMDEDVVPEEAPRRMIFDLNEPAPLDMDLNQPNQQGRMMFDLNELAHPDMEINRNDED
ncbi:hypothetical protein SLEP1_g35464 [Rubroshorea leprosula]|uniref:TF-B3 domain-containing protein n=1 Tax=Rubroshorea leprosula TaxID=152421 RepID=A0AAV5KNS3_9ROSI|nr:hypothetical protein SLEP1_g35464 [Rubroshorea leprosula]